MLAKRKIKIFMGIAIIISVLIIFIGKNYSDNDNHYVVDVVKENATSKDSNVKLTESIVKNQGEEYFDSKILKYQVDLENIKENNVETQVAMVIDTSYSMSVNDTNSVVKNKATELALGILCNVKNSKISISNNSSTKIAMTNDSRYIRSEISAMISGEGNDSNDGLDKAYSTFIGASNSQNIVKKYIIVFTDSTDHVAEKMQTLTESDPNLEIISILVDMTSSSYINNRTPVCGEVYLLPSEVSETDLQNSGNMLDSQKIYDKLNRIVKDIKVSNVFLDEISKYFEISDLTATEGTVTKTETGYDWNIDKAISGNKAKMTYTLTLKTDIDIDSGIIFNELFTNKTQDITYQSYDNQEIQNLKGTDSREGTESTLIKICQGYDMKIKAVNESNKDLAVEGVQFKVEGTNENGEKVCNLTKTTDAEGYITITANDSKALRGDGKITYIVTPYINLVGYSRTDSVTYNVTSNKITRKLSYDNNQSNLEGIVDEQKRTIEVIVPINSERIDFEIKTEELNNSGVSISGCEFELIQPKLNNKYEMDVLSGKTDETGIVHFAPTVMTKDGTYNYILRQVNAPDSYDITELTLIEITYRNGKITNISKQFNPNVETKLCDDMENHVLITVKDECVEQNPFDLQINLDDKENNVKIEGVTYLVTTTNSNNQVRNQYVTTDEKGQINTKIYGTGNLNIKIIEQSPKVGYISDTVIKELNVNRSNNVITIWNCTVGLNLNQDSDHKNIIVNLASVKKAEQNMVRVELVDSDEQDVTVGKNVIYYLRDIETEAKYGPAISDKNGNLSFTVDSKAEGQHSYSLEVDKETVPSEYDEEKIENAIRLNLTFDKTGYIVEENIVNNNTVIDEHYSKVLGEGTIEYTCFIKIGYELIEDNTREFKIQLSDKDETTRPIAGAKYDIDIEWDINGITKTKTIKDRMTNTSGIITTRIVKADEVRIFVKEVGASAGYTCDSETQEIYLKFDNNGQIVITSQRPYDRGKENKEELNQGAYINTNTVVYQHYNKKRTLQDTYLNLTVNKIDMNGAYVGGVVVGFNSSTLLTEKGEQLNNLNMSTGEQGSDGTITFDYKNYIENINDPNSKEHTIKVPGIGIEGDEKVYYLEMYELQQVKSDPPEYSKKEGTTVKIRLIFRNKEGRAVLTNVETIYGNRLVKTKSFSYVTDEQKTEEDKLGVFLSNVTLDVYTNYEDVGNLSLDFEKQDNREQKLNGAKYDLKIVNPDTTVIRKTVTVDNGEDSSSIELSGVTVNVGSLIYLTEKQAPIGYAINNNTETLEVKQITEDGEVILEQVDKTYSKDRLILEKLASGTTEAGTEKTNYKIKLIDYQIDTFDFGIQTVDSSTLEGLEGNKFDIQSSLGAQSSIVTDAKGNGNVMIGGNIESQTITYTISSDRVTEYYKKLKNPIKVNVVFDISGNVDAEKTMNQQTDANYGKLWTIENIETNGKIKIKILIDRQDPLVVKLETLDKITNNVISNVEYKITDSQVLPATGNTSIDVGYALIDGTRTYKLAETSINSAYANIKDKTFTVTYVNEKITDAIITSDESKDNIRISGDKEIKITSYAEPKTPFEIKDAYYFDKNVKLQGSNFEITEQSSQDIGVGTTNIEGIAGIYSGIFGTNEIKTYKVRQTLGSLGKATVEDFYVKVTYNENREITSAILVDENGEELTNKFIEISTKKESTFSTYNGNRNGIVEIQIFNYPEFKMNIEDVDRRDETKKLEGTEYSVSSKYTTSNNTSIDFTSTEGVVTNKDGIGIAHLDKTKENTVVKYTLKETTPATGYQSLGTDINIIVTYDEDGYVNSVDLEDKDNLSKIASVSKLDTVSNPEDNFAINVKLKNNPILKFNLTAQDNVNHDSKIKDVGLQIISKYNDEIYSNSSATNKVNKGENPETSYTDINGYAASYVDRTLDNKDMYYVIKEVQKTAGYEWNNEDIIIKVSYDANGKISTITPVQGETFIDITSFNADEFEISLNIYNEEIKEFGVHLSAVDTYDKNKKLNDIKVEAFLSEGINYDSDGKYELIGDNALISGADRDNSGTPDLSFGEDYKTIGKYVEGAGTRKLRLIIKNDSYKTRQSGYYLDSSNGTSNGKNIGYHRGSLYNEDAKYQTVEYQYLINVTFDDEGKITNATINSGLYNNIGWLTDDRYLEVDHTNYKLNITMKFFPLFDLKLSAMDNYTYENEIGEKGQPIELNGSKYTVSTQAHSDGGTKRGEFVRAGYIGYGNSYGYHEGMIDGSIYEDTNELYIPIEKSYSRVLYVFEESEPNNYQKYAKRHIENYNQRLIAIINVSFNEYGEIDYNNSIVRKVNDTTIEPYMNEDGSSLSGNNIKEYKYYYNKTKSNRNINFFIGYSLSTKLTVRAVDDISNSPIANIKMLPFCNNTEISNMSYEYNPIGYRYTDGNGVSGWTYWGGAERDKINTYIIGSSRNGNNYNGYLFPSDMASKTLGGSEKAEDYFAKLDITYDSNGKISKVQSLGADLWGDNNVTNITWDSQTGNVYINMLYSRKLQTTLNKVDYYDNTINGLRAEFKVISNKGLNTDIVSKQMTPIGKVYKNETVKYTLSETQVPNGYYPISGILDYYVTFDANGNISKNRIKSESEYFEVISTSESTEKVNKTIADLNMNIKNKPAFNISTQVIDKFYKNDGLANVYLKVSNSKGDLASGNPQTDSRGYANITVGPVYPNETIIYYLEQTNTVDGYYQNSTKVQLQVKYNSLGKIEDYKILNGNEIINNFDNSQFKNSRTISMQIMNMPKVLNIGLYKYDKTTNSPMAGVPFTITNTDINSGNTTTENIVTNEDGSVIAQIDTFNTSMSGKVIKYKIHENETPASYRTMEDVVFLIRYNAEGSIASCNQIENDNQILNTKVKLDIATNGVIKYLNNQRVHFKVSVPNDNSFDLIIKNEDINHSGLGIEKTEYDVSINGEICESNPTNQNGKTTIEDITKSGDITLNIAQKKVGEGYKDDIDNKIAIKLQKGVDIYSLNLNSETEGYIDNKNANNGKALVKVDEEYGKIEVIFKNETKTELTVIKQDINTKMGLKDAEFEITAQKVDNNGNTIGEELTLTTDENKITDQDGKIHLELGVSPQSEIWKYTFKEKVPPEGYNQIIDLTMTVRYDQYGRIISQVSNNDSRLKTIMEDDYYNCHSMYAVIYNGDISPSYELKVITEDAETGKRINGSKIYLNITDAETGDLITVEPKTVGSSNNGLTSETKNLSIDGNMLTDEEIEETTEQRPIIIEKGLTYIDNINYEGTINIEISQKETAPGYIFGNQKTDGNIKINTTYIPHLEEDPTAEFTVIENDGFNVIVDNKNRTITIKMLNESQVLFDITNKLYGSDNKGIEGSNFSITAEIQTATDSILTDVNVTTPLTDENGKTKGNVGKAYAGKTVLYTLKQSISKQYYSIDDIQIEVKYDSKGYIKYCELLSSENSTNINEDQTSGRTISITIQNRKEISGYTLYVEKHAMDTEIDENAYGKVLSGAKYEITVNQKDSGIEYTTWTDTTDEKGIIEGLTFNGFGYIEITLEEIAAPDGYAIEDLRKIMLYRDINTGEIEVISGDINFEHNEDFTEVWLKPIDNQAKDKYTLVINKISTATGKYITSDQTQFEAALQKEDEEGNILYKDTIDNIFTNKKGKAIIDNLDLPTEKGEYKLIITEIKAPEGYKKLQKPIELKVNFEQDSQNQIIISTVAEDYEKVSISKVTKQLIGINFGNDVDEEIKEDEYSLDITKIDAETNTPIEEMSLFKVLLPDENKTSVYAETCETLTGPGKLDYCYIEQDKDYTARLTHMKKPEKEGTYKYIFKEILAPEGYEKINEDLELTLEFKKDRTTNQLVINKATSSNEKYLRINTQTPCSTDTKLSIDILNYITDQNEFTIHYEANDKSEGTTVPADQIKQKDVDLILDTMELTREGYIFKGWSTLPDSREAQFKPGDKITSNQDITLYAIWEEKLYLKSTEYIIGDKPENYNNGDLTEYKEGCEYISGILPYTSFYHEDRTKAEEFKNKIVTNADTIEILNNNGNKINENDLIGTNMILKLTKGSKEIQIRIIVTGDTNGDGKLTVGDMSAINAHRFNTQKLEGAFLKAADTNHDNQITVGDISLLKAVRTGIKDF